MRSRMWWRALLWALAALSFTITLVLAWWAVQAAWLSAFENADVERLRAEFWARVGLAVVFLAGMVAFVTGALRKAKK